MKVASIVRLYKLKEAGKIPDSRATELFNLIDSDPKLAPRKYFQLTYMMRYKMSEVKRSKEQLQKLSTDNIKIEVEKDCWISLKRYFDGWGNGPEAKIAVVALGTLAKEQQSRNNARQLDL